MHGYYLNIKILFDYLVLNNVKVLWTMHDCWAITGHCSHFDFVACNKWKSQCHHCPQKKEYPTSLFFDQSKSNYQIKKKLFNSLENLTIVPVSFWLENILKESFLNKYPTRVIHNGIDVEVFSPGVSSFRDKFNIKAEKKIILGVANIWNGRKGLKDLIHISEKLGTDYQVVIAGLNHQQLKHLPETIIKLPRTNDKHFLVSLYRAANVFVNPTVEDSFPTTNLEAMACGTPVITYKTGGCEEAIIEGVGKTIEKGDVKEMISSIKNISKLSMSDSCSKHIRKNFNNKIQYQKYIKQYHHILN